MLRPSLSPVLLAVATILAGACARPARPPSPPPSPWDGLALRDSASIRRFCVAPDSVLAGRRLCELHARP